MIYSVSDRSPYPCKLLRFSFFSCLSSRGRLLNEDSAVSVCFFFALSGKALSI
jgi:hypothetical protein